MASRNLGKGWKAAVGSLEAIPKPTPMPMGTRGRGAFMGTLAGVVTVSAVDGLWCKMRTQGGYGMITESTRQ